jgi:hypothetical protein
MVANAKSGRFAGTRSIARVLVRYGTFYGDGSYSESDRMPPPPRIHVDEAARGTLPLLDAPSGVVVVEDDT